MSFSCLQGGSAANISLWDCSRRAGPLRCCSASGGSKFGVSPSWNCQPAWTLPAIASTTEPARRHYFVEIRSGTAAVRRVALSRFGTLREVVALSDWLRENTSVRSVTVVSSGYHLKRVRLCCRRLMPEGTKLTFVAVPEESRYLRTHWWRNPQSRKLILSEALKIATYKLLCLGVTKKVRSSIGLLQGRLSADCVSAEGS